MWICYSPLLLNPAGPIIVVEGYLCLWQVSFFCLRDEDKKKVNSDSVSSKPNRRSAIPVGNQITSISVNIVVLFL